MRLGFKLLWNLKPFTICSTSHCAIHTKHPPFHVTLSLFLSPHSLSLLPLHLMLLLFNILAASVSLVKWPQRLFLIWRSWCTLVFLLVMYILHTPLQDVKLGGAPGRSKEKDIYETMESWKLQHGYLSPLNSRIFFTLREFNPITFSTYIRITGFISLLGFATRLNLLEKKWTPYPTSTFLTTVSTSGNWAKLRLFVPSVEFFFSVS